MGGFCYGEVGREVLWFLTSSMHYVKDNVSRMHRESLKVLEWNQYLMGKRNKVKYSFFCDILYRSK